MTQTTDEIEARVLSYGFSEPHLLARRAVLITLLRQLHKSLEATTTATATNENDELAPMLDSNGNPFERSSGLKNAVLKPLTKLSHRGHQLAVLMHKNFSLTYPSLNVMTFRDFRGYLSAVGRPGELKDVMDHEESFKMFASELNGDNNNCDSGGNLTADGFVKYREIIESNDTADADGITLEKDILKLNMSLLPTDLLQWKTNTTNFDRIDEENVIHSNNSTLNITNEFQSEPLTYIPITEMQLLLADCNEFYTQEQISEMMHVNHNFRDVVDEIKHKKAREKKKDNDAMQRDSVRKQSFLSYMASSRYKPSLTFLISTILKFKTYASRIIRNTTERIISFRTQIERLIQREILTPRLLNSLKSDISKFEVNVTCGDVDNVDDGISASIKLSKIDRASQYFSEQKLPKGVGTAMIIDFIARTDATKNEINNAVSRLNQVFKTNMETELNKIPLFHSSKVSSYKNPTDNIDLIRVTVAFEKTSSIDYVLRELDIGFTLPDVLPEFNLGVKCSLSLVDVFDNRRVKLEKELSFKGQFVGCLARGLAVKVLDEVMLQVEEDEILDDLEEKNDEVINKGRSERTKKSHPLNPTFGEILIGGEVKIEKRTNTEIDHELHEKTAYRKKIWSLILLLRGTKGSVLDFSFRNITDLLYGSKFIKGYLPVWLRRDYFKEAGSVTKMWRNYAIKLKDEIVQNLNVIVEFRKIMRAEKALKEEEELRSNGVLSDMQKRRIQLNIEKEALSTKLASLGIKLDPNLLKKEAVKHTFVELLKQWKAAQTTANLHVIQCYAAMHTACVGVHGITVLSGTNKLEVNANGLDLFEVLPEVEIEDFDVSGDE